MHAWKRCTPPCLQCNRVTCTQPTLHLHSEFTRYLTACMKRERHLQDDVARAVGGLQEQRDGLGAVVRQKDDIDPLGNRARPRAGHAHAHRRGRQCRQIVHAVAHLKRAEAHSHVLITRFLCQEQRVSAGKLHAVKTASLLRIVELPISKQHPVKLWARCSVFALPHASRSRGHDHLDGPKSSARKLLSAGPLCADVVWSWSEYWRHACIHMS